MNIEVGGILGLIVLVLNIWAIINILGAGGTVGSKLLWILLIILLPVIGVVIWLLMGPRSQAA